MLTWTKAVAPARAPRRQAAPRVERLEGRRLLANSVEAVTFQGAGFTAVVSDPTPGAGAGSWVTGSVYGGPEWTPAHSYPVSYSVGSTMDMTATINLDAAPPPKTVVMVRGTGPDGVTIPAKAAEPKGKFGTEYSVIQDVSTPLGMTVRFYNPFTINWESSTDGGKTWVADGQSQDKLFLTLAKPIGTPILTVLQVSTMGADGVTLGGGAGAMQAAQDAAAPKIFAPFKTLTVRTADPAPGDVTTQGAPMFYYKTYLTRNVDLRQLLAYKDGQCGSWADFLISALRMQGINQANSYAVVKAKQVGALPPSGFLVNNWTFGAPTNNGAVSKGQYPYINIPDPGGYIQATSYKWTKADVTQGVGVPGQGKNASPASFFNNHQIVRYTSGAGTLTYYDPSVGLTYSSLDNLDQKAIAGYYKEMQQKLGGVWTTVFVIKKEDPTKLGLLTESDFSLPLI